MSEDSYHIDWELSNILGKILTRIIYLPFVKPSIDYFNWILSKGNDKGDRI